MAGSEPERKTKKNKALEWTISTYKKSPTCKETCRAMRQMCTILSTTGSQPKDLKFGCKKRESMGRQIKRKHLWTMKDRNSEPTCESTCAERGMQCVQLRGKQHMAGVTFSCGRPARGKHRMKAHKSDPNLTTTRITMRTTAIATTTTATKTTTSTRPTTQTTMNYANYGDYNDEYNDDYNDKYFY